MAQMYTLLRLQVDGKVATVQLNRQPNNAISIDLVEELDSAFSELEANKQVRVVVLSSAIEKYFSVGADLSALGGMSQGQTSVRDSIKVFVQKIQASFNKIDNFRAPVIAAINGHALGGGCELSLCCDYRIMIDDERSYIGQTEVLLGLIPGAGGTQRLPRLIGMAKALPLLFEGTRLKAKEAQAIGLVHDAVEPERFWSYVNDLAAKLAKGAPIAQSLIKSAVKSGIQMPLSQGLELEADYFANVATTQDALTGIMAFFSKEEPEFKGT
jgi:enoyl-CoA hydratase/carnithine racemase